MINKLKWATYFWVNGILRSVQIWAWWSWHCDNRQRLRARYVTASADSEVSVWFAILHNRTPLLPREPFCSASLSLRHLLFSAHPAWLLPFIPNYFSQTHKRCQVELAGLRALHKQACLFTLRCSVKHLLSCTHLQSLVALFASGQTHRTNKWA